jgi:NAD(P)-dependent dehydrogenase (short-subunit alcohol dehydrogenase family)
VRQPQVTDYPIPHYAATLSSARLSGKVAIVTGCNSDKGIGRATAMIFAASGAKAVIICDVDSSNLKTWSDEIGKRYPNTIIEWRQFDAAGMKPFKLWLTKDEREVKQVVEYLRIPLSG